MLRRLFLNLHYKLQSSMYGRYGIDELSKALIVFALVLSFINIIANSLIIYALSAAALVYAVFRAYSKNISKRQKERYFYNQKIGKIKSFIRLRKRIWRERKFNRYFKCPKCKAYLHVPKGKGKIIITCPKCKNEIPKRT